MRNTFLYTIITFISCFINSIDLQASNPYLTKDSSTTDALTINNEDLKKSKSGLDKEINYSAEDSLDVDNETKIVHLYGKAVVTYGTIKLEADYIWIDMEKNELHAYGKKDSSGYCYEKAAFTDKDQKFNSSEISYNFKTQKGRVVEVITQEGESYIHGEVIKRLPNNVIYVGEGKYTTCNAEHPHFHFNTTKIKMIQNDKIVTGPVNLVINDVPTPLILPFGIFPNNPKKASGILIPAYGENKSQGFYLNNLGFHWAISDKINYTLYTDIFTQGSWALKNTINYKIKYRFDGSLSFNYTNTISGDRDLYNFAKRKDFRFTWNHRQDNAARPGSTFSASVNFGTASAFTNSLVASNNVSSVLNNTYNSSIAYTQKLNNRLTLTTNASHTQNMITRDVNIQAPTFTLRMSPYTVKKGVWKGINMQWGMDIGNSMSVKDTNMLKAIDLWSIKNGMRNSASFSYSGSFKPVKFLNISLPSISINNYSYATYVIKGITNKQLTTSEKAGFSNTTSIQLGGIGVNTQLFVTYRPVKKSKIVYLKHIIKPSVSFSQNARGIEKFLNDNQMFSSYTDTTNISRTYNRLERGLYGTPVSANVSQLSFNLENSLDIKIRKKVNGRDTTEKVRLIKAFNISSGYNLAASSFNWSDFNALLTTDMFNGLINLNCNATASPYAMDSKGTKINTLMINGDGDWGRITSASANASMRLASSKAKTKTVFAKIPSDIYLTYSLQYRKPSLTSDVTQVVQISGNIALTNKWGFMYSTGYDLQNQKMTLTNFTITRDLHCWTMMFVWVPFGDYQSYTFTLQPKASLLKEMKYRKQQSWNNNLN